MTCVISPAKKISRRRPEIEGPGVLENTPAARVGSARATLSVPAMPENSITPSVAVLIRQAGNVAPCARCVLSWLVGMPARGARTARHSDMRAATGHPFAASAQCSGLRYASMSALSSPRVAPPRRPEPTAATLAQGRPRTPPRRDLPCCRSAGRTRHASAGGLASGPK